MKYTHYLITRFNVHEAAWKQVDKHRQPICNDAWMEHRFVLFEKYCLPSVRAQIRGFFKWVILVDRNTAPEYLDRLNREDVSIIQVGNAWQRNLQQYLNEDCDTRWMITTRLDNDDAIAPFMIQVVQDSFDRQEFTFIDFPKGYRQQGGRLYTHNEPCNPFLSLISRIGDKPRTVYSVEHGIRVAQKYHVILGSMTPAWIQVLHARNKVTDRITGEPVEATGWVKRYV
jgi:hypothetical protein